MKLYYSKGACSFACRVIINELGLSCDYESVDIKSKHKRTETGKDFLTVNPKGSVPVLVTDEGQVLTENAVILQYLTSLSHANQLFPPLNGFKRYRVLEWLNFLSSDLHKSASNLFNSSIPPAIKDQLFIPQFKNKLIYIDKQLEGKRYLCGEQFTLPDAYLFTILNWLPLFNMNVKEWHNIENYSQSMKKRASVQQSLKDEALITEQEKLT